MKTLLLSFTALIGLIIYGSNRNPVPESRDIYDLRKTNYIPYFLEIYKADSLLILNKDQEAFQKLDSLFKIYSPINQLTYSEMLNYVLLSEKLDKRIDSKKYIESLIRDWGVKVKELKKESILNSVLKKNFSDTELLALEQQHMKNIDWEYRKVLKEMFTADQSSRGKQEEPEIDESNIKKLIHLIQTKGYPDIPTVGKIADDGIMLPLMYFHIGRAEEYKELKALVLENIKKGKATPFEIKQLIQAKYHLAYGQDYFQQTNQSATNPRRIKTTYPKDTFSIRRNKIGLPSLEYEKWKNSLMGLNNN
ncbi:hypothetical protein ACQWU4_12655 [Chryseobacterium sp. MIQD13]|uniref:hypothetical protein n=1 Tax=Chryseobacterium sp. MIQD13 TaxID=3422310 RepID=UPI003D27FDB6